MKLYLGIDGGGTKTSFYLANANGDILANTQLNGCSYQRYGIDAVVQTLLEGMQRCAESASVPLDAIVAVAAGIPCYGESPDNDRKLADALQRAFHPRQLYITNDVEVAWAGALTMEAGINIVAGTGSIAYGRDEEGHSARGGGWLEFFSDEGSGFWLGKKTMELFSKQSDGRSPRSALYTVIRDAYSLESDIDFIDIMREEIIPYREKVAAMHLHLKEAALQGDQAALSIYQVAAKELSLLAYSVYSQLHFTSTPVTVSYTGGVFKAGNLILKSLAFELAKYGFDLRPSKLSPSHGAVLLAIDRFAHEHVTDAAKNMLSQ